MAERPLTALRLAREALGLSIREMRAISGVSTGRLSMLERAMVKPNPSECARLASALERSVAELFPNLFPALTLCEPPAPEASLRPDLLCG